MPPPQDLVDAATCYSCLNQNQLLAVQAYLLDQIWKAPPATGPHNLLSLTHLDTVPGSPVKGALIVGNSTPKWEAFPIGADGNSLLADSTQPSGVRWGAPVMPGGFTGFADPTAMVGLTPVNGVATTAMRSDAAPALDQGITPTWTNLHIFDPPDNTLAIWVTGSNITGANAQSIIDFRSTWSTTGAPVAILLDVTNAASAPSSKLIDLRAGAISRFLVTAIGLTQTTVVDTGVGSSPTCLEIYHATTGVPTINNGVSFDLSMDTDTAERRFGGRYSVDWSNVTDATRSSRMRFIVVNAGVTTEAFQISSVDGISVKNAPLLQLQPFGAAAGNTCHLRFMELTANGFEYVGFKAPDSILSSAIYVLPSVAPSANRFLRAGAVAANVSTTTWEQIGLTADVTGVLPIVNGGTNSSTALNNDRIMVSSGGAIVEAAALTNGQLLIGSNGVAPVAASLTAGANITITPGAGSITIAASGVVTAAYSTVQEEGVDLTQRSILNFIGPFTAADDAGNAKTNVTLTGAALTKTDDTNITLTLGGSPSTALLAAASLTLGWTGVLSLARGGTNKSITAAAGAVVWSDADSLELTAAGTSGQVLVSAGAGSPVWQSPATAIAHTVLDGSVHTDTVAQTVTRGSLIYGNATPKWDELAIGASARFLQSDGTDPSWVAMSGDATIAAGGALTIANNAVTLAKMADMATLSVIGRSTAGTGDPEVITADLDFQVLRRSGTTLDFGAINLASSNAVTGILPVTNGGTGTGTTFTQGSVIFAGASGVYSQDNANFFWDDTNNRLGIGTSAPSSPLHVLKTFGAVSGNSMGFFSQIFASPTANEGTFAYIAGGSAIEKTGAFNLTTVPGGIRGYQIVAANSGSGALTEAAAYFSWVINGGTGTIATGINFYAVAPLCALANPITNCYGLYIADQRPTGVTNGFGVYSAGVNDFNFFAGRIQVKATPNDMASYSLTNWNGTGQPVTAFFKAPTENGGGTPNAAEPAMILGRNGANGLTYPTLAEFKIRRWETGGGASARTALDIALTHGENAPAGTDVLSLLSNGCVGIGTLQPQARLHLPAGTATARTAPIMFTTGTSLTTAVAGAMEYTTDDLFFTISTGAARKRLLMADPVSGLTSGRVPFATTNGRLTDDGNLTYDSGDGHLFTNNLTVNTFSFLNNDVFVGNDLDVSGSANVSGGLSVGLTITSYNGIPTEGFGVGAIVDNLALTGQSSNIAATPFTNAGVVGTYRVGYYLVCTTADAAAGTIRLDITFNDGTVARSLTGVAIALTATNRATKFTNTESDGSLIRLGSGSIQYSVVLVSGAILTARYSLYCTLERLS